MSSLLQFFFLFALFRPGQLCFQLNIFWRCYGEALYCLWHDKVACSAACHVLWHLPFLVWGQMSASELNWLGGAGLRWGGWVWVGCVHSLCSLVNFEQSGVDSWTLVASRWSSTWSCHMVSTQRKGLYYLFLFPIHPLSLLQSVREIFEKVVQCISQQENGGTQTKTSCSLSWAQNFSVITLQPTSFCWIKMSDKGPQDPPTPLLVHISVQSHVMFLLTFQGDLMMCTVITSSDFSPLRDVFHSFGQIIIMFVLRLIHASRNVELQNVTI